MSDSPTKERINHQRIDELLESRLVADPGATYAKEFYLNLSTLSPFVAGPNSTKVANPVNKLESQNIAIDKAYLLSCTNGRSEDFAAAARVFREAGSGGKPAKIHPNVKLYLAPASRAEQQAAKEAGDWQVLEQSGAVILPAGCGPCIGLVKLSTHFKFVCPILILDTGTGLARGRRGRHIRLVPLEFFNTPPPLSTPFRTSFL